MWWLQVFRMDMKMDQTIIMLNAIVKRLEDREEQSSRDSTSTDAQVNHDEEIGPWRRQLDNDKMLSGLLVSTLYAITRSTQHNVWRVLIKAKEQACREKYHND